MPTINTAGDTLSGNTPMNDSPRMAVGRIVLDSTALTATEAQKLTIGFTPKYVRFENITDRIMVEWFEGMAADTCIKTAAAGTRTIETTNQGITICDEDGNAATAGRCAAVSQNATLAVVAASKTCTWIALG